MGGLLKNPRGGVAENPWERGPAPRRGLSTRVSICTHVSVQVTQVARPARRGWGCRTRGHPLGCGRVWGAPVGRPPSLPAEVLRGQAGGDPLPSPALSLPPRVPPRGSRGDGTGALQDREHPEGWEERGTSPGASGGAGRWSRSGGGTPGCWRIEGVRGRGAGPGYPGVRGSPGKGGKGGQDVAAGEEVGGGPAAPQGDGEAGGHSWGYPGVRKKLGGEG